MTEKEMLERFEQDVADYYYSNSSVAMKYIRAKYLLLDGWVMDRIERKIRNTVAQEKLLTQI